jgi:uncharacterized protein (TIGR00251 family)
MKKIISVTVVPRASKNEVIPLEDGMYRVRITAAPVDGEANKKLIEIISEYFDVPKSCIVIVKGLRGKKKVVEVEIPPLRSK